MKHILIPLLLLMLFCMPTLSEAQDRFQERVKAQKVAFITQRLNLSPDEAQKFWPIYNAFEQKSESIRRNDLKEVREAMDKGDLSPAESSRILDLFIAAEDKLHNAKKQLIQDLLKAIPAQKIIALKKAEDDFNKKLIKLIQDRQSKMQQMRQRN